MEGAINGFNVLYKAKIANTTTCYSCQLNNTESFPSKIIMMGHHHQDDGANKMPCSSEHQNVYSDEASIVLPPVTAGGSAVVRTLQPFDISTNNSQGKKGFLCFPLCPLDLIVLS